MLSPELKARLDARNDTPIVRSVEEALALFHVQSGNVK